jgi:hypothetical protein
VKLFTSIFSAALCIKCIAAVVYVQWDKPDPPELVDKYVVFRYDGETPVPVSTVPGSQFTASAPAQTGTNVYFVKAVNSAGIESFPSNLAYWVVSSAPKIINGKLNGILPNSTNRFTWGIAWSKPSTNVIAYDIVITGPFGPFRTNRVSQTSVQFSGLTNGIGYWASVRTIDSVGDFSPPTEFYVKHAAETLDGSSVLKYTTYSEIR